MSKITILGEAQITRSDRLAIELIEADETPQSLSFGGLSRRRFCIRVASQTPQPSSPAYSPRPRQPWPASRRGDDCTERGPGY
jgi:hypothetical protein